MQPWALRRVVSTRRAEGFQNTGVLTDAEMAVWLGCISQPNLLFEDTDFPTVPRQSLATCKMMIPEGPVQCSRHDLQDNRALGVCDPHVRLRLGVFGCAVGLGRLLAGVLLQVWFQSLAQVSSLHIRQASCNPAYTPGSLKGELSCKLHAQMDFIHRVMHEQLKQACSMPTHMQAWKLEQQEGP